MRSLSFSLIPCAALLAFPSCTWSRAVQDTEPEDTDTHRDDSDTNDSAGCTSPEPHCCAEWDYSAGLHRGDLQNDTPLTGSFTEWDAPPVTFESGGISYQLAVTDAANLGFGMLPDLTSAGSVSVVRHVDDGTVIEIWDPATSELLLATGSWNPWEAYGWSVRAEWNPDACPERPFPDCGTMLHNMPTRVTYGDWSTEIWTGETVEVGGYRIHVGGSESLDVPHDCDDGPSLHVSWFIARLDLYP